MIPPRAFEIDRLIDEASSHFTLQRINPVESGKIRRTRASNPVFEYAPASHSDLTSFKADLRGLSFGQSEAEQVLEQKRDELLKKIDLMEKIGKPGFSDASVALYAPPDEELVATAHKVLSLEAAAPSPKILREDAIRMLQRCFSSMGLEWSIQSKDMVVSANVDGSHRILRLKKRERFSERYVKRLLIHEIGTHALRAENGSVQPLSIFRHGFAHYLETEEGLAAYHEYLSGLMSNSILRTYAGRVLAVDYAMRHDFLYVYEQMRKYFRDRTAWTLAMRAKRGMDDPAKPGAFTKDTVYLRGFLKVARFVRDGGDLSDLYFGKYALEDLDFVRSLQLKPLRFNPQNLMQERESYALEIDELLPKLL